MAGVCTGPGPCDTAPLGTGDNWLKKVGGLPAYIRAIAHSLRRGGMDESRAISTAIATVKRWAVGGGNVTAATRARAAKAVAEWEVKKAASHSLTADPAATVDLAFTEALHPRGKTGTPQGGRFVAKGSSSGGTDSMAAQTKDFQRRTGLKRTGRYDAATAAKVNRLLNPKSGGKAGGGKGKSGKQTPAQKRASAARTASAVNGLNAAQRELYRAKRPTPPLGYRWTGDSRLVAVGASPEARAVRRLLRKP